MPSASEIARLRRSVERMEAECGAIENLPKFRDTARQFDKSLSKITARKRGERTKLNGALLLEDMAVGAVRVLKGQYRKDGIPTDDAWIKARAFVARVLEISPATIEDWQRGAAGRRRRKTKRAISGT